MSLALQQAWRTLRQSPLAFALTVILLAAAAYVPSFTRAGFENAQQPVLKIPIEFELSSGYESARDSIIGELHKLDEIRSVVSLTPGDVRREVLAELGDSLAGVFEERDFPSIVRFTLAARSAADLQAFTAKWSRATGVARVVYPEEIAMSRIPDREASPVFDRTKVWAISATSWALAGLCLRAMFFRRRSTWRLFIWSGCSRSMMFVVRLWLGFYAGVFASALWYAATYALSSSTLIELVEIGTGLIGTVLLGLTASVWLVGAGGLGAER